jgi:pyruvate dehydrogenase E2 component (dihydrolipoamide acetyltransferase)
MAIFSFKLPDIGEGMHEGEIVKWHIKPGDQVDEDQVILEVQNDKAVVELPSPVKGIVKEVKVAEGTVSIVGEVLVTFEVEGEAAAEVSGAEAVSAVGGADTDAKAAAPADAPAPADHKQEQSGVPSGASSAKVLATPSTRRLAREKGVAIAQINGTGRHGQVTREDVLAAAGGKQAAPTTEVAAVQTPAVSTATAASGAGASSAGAAVPGYREEERVPLKGIRKVIANAMVKSVYTAPHVTIMDEVDVSKLVEFREQLKPVMEKKGVKVTYLPFIVKALVAAVRKYPVLNASIDDEKGEIVYKKYYNIGIATDTDNGLIVPVVDDADRKSMWTIAAQIKDLAARGREGKLAGHEMRGSTISISNIGSAGGMFFTPVINWPEVAILGTGRISEKPVVRGGELAVGKVMALSLSFDHRIIDGATAQLAMNDIKELLENPQLLVMEV